MICFQILIFSHRFLNTLNPMAFHCRCPIQNNRNQENQRCRLTRTYNHLMGILNIVFYRAVYSIFLLNSGLKLLKLRTLPYQFDWFLHKLQKVHTSSFHTSQLIQLPYCKTQWLHRLILKLHRFLQFFEGSIHQIPIH